MPNFTLIQTITTANNQSTIAFNSIPQIYNDLYLTIIGRSTTSATQAGLDVQFNGDTGTNYDTEQLYSVGPGQVGVQGINGTTGFEISQFPGSLTPANIAACADVMILNYTDTSFDKLDISRSGYMNNSSNACVFNNRHLWKNVPQAITSILLITPGSFVNGSVASLYGVPA